MRAGGNDPAIVLPDVDIKDAAPKIFQGAMNNTGQVCVAIKRVFVHESKYEEMVDAMKEQAAKALPTFGDGLEEGTRFGPINNRMQLARVSELVEDAKASGARVAAGGNEFALDDESGDKVMSEDQFVLWWTTLDKKKHPGFWETWCSKNAGAHSNFRPVGNVRAEVIVSSKKPTSGRRFPKLWLS